MCYIRRYCGKRQRSGREHSPVTDHEEDGKHWRLNLHMRRHAHRFPGNCPAHLVTLTGTKTGREVSSQCGRRLNRQRWNRTLGGSLATKFPWPWPSLQRSLPTFRVPSANQQSLWCITASRIYKHCSRLTQPSKVP